jgi:signal transduction histidine kinase
VVSVSDDGCGFDVDLGNRASAERMTFGLFSIRERLEVLGGSMVLESRPGSGTSITLTVPVTSELQEDPQ